MCRSNLFRYFCKEKSFSNYLPETPLDYFAMFIIYCIVTVSAEKNYMFESTVKIFPLDFHDAPITPFRTFLQDKAFFFHAPF